MINRGRIIGGLALLKVPLKSLQEAQEILDGAIDLLKEQETREYSASADGYEVEWCSNCEREIELRWDINKDGFQAYCPVCGERLMLCDACQHRDGTLIQDCDYVSSADWCRFRRPKDWWKGA